MWREIRRVPPEWKHPKDGSGCFKPLTDLDFYQMALSSIADMTKWIEEYNDFEKYCREFKTSWGKVYSKKNWDSYEDRAGKISEIHISDPDEFMPKWDWRQLYENISDWTPLSPPFPTAELLIERLSNNKDFRWNQWTKTQAEGIVRKWSVLSGCFTDGKFLTPQEIAGA